MVETPVQLTINYTVSIFLCISKPFTHLPIASIGCSQHPKYYGIKKKSGVGEE